VPTACYVGLASRRLLLLPVLAARASMFVIMARCFLALMPLAVSENPERTATGQIGPILEGSCAGARWHGASRLRTPRQDRHRGAYFAFGPRGSMAAGRPETHFTYSDSLKRTSEAPGAAWRTRGTPEYSRTGRSSVRRCQ
jgi:hypothetical protein